MITVDRKEKNHLDEIMIMGLNTPYAIIYQEDGKATLDIHIKIQDATRLLKGLETALRNQVVSPSVDR